MPAAWLRIVRVTKHEILCQRIQSKYPDCSKYLLNCLNVHLQPVKIKIFCTTLNFYWLFFMLNKILITQYMSAKFNIISYEVKSLNKEILKYNYFCTQYTYNYNVLMHYDLDKTWKNYANRYRHRCVPFSPSSLVPICLRRNLWDVERDHLIAPEKIFQ